MDTSKRTKGLPMTIPEGSYPAYLARLAGECCWFLATESFIRRKNIHSGARIPIMMTCLYGKKLSRERGSPSQLSQL